MEARCGLQGRASSCLGEHLESSFEGHPGSDTHRKNYKKQEGFGSQNTCFSPQILPPQPLGHAAIWLAERAAPPARPTGSLRVGDTATKPVKSLHQTSARPGTGFQTQRDKQALLLGCIWPQTPTRNHPEPLAGREVSSPLHLNTSSSPGLDWSL